jgi:hypothetical protein
MPNEVAESASKEKSLLRWGGLAGIVGAVMIVLSIIAGLFAPPLFVPAQPGGSCGPACYVDAALAGFPSVKASIIAENALYFAAIVSFAIFFLALYRALGGDNLAPALFGSGLALLGLAMEGVGALPGVAFAHLSEVYQAAGPQDQATLVLVSHAVQAIFNATDTVGGILLAVGFAFFGVAMFQKSTGFGKRFGGATIAVSLVALVGIFLISIGTDNPNDPFFVILLLVLPLILGLKLYKLSRSSW